MEQKPLFAPERAGTWAIAAFALALIALTVSLVDHFRFQKYFALTQLEVVQLAKKIEAVSKKE